MLDSGNPVGLTGQHLFKNKQKIHNIQYRQQKAWLRSSKIKVTKEAKCRKEEWRRINMTWRMNLLGEINKKWVVVEGRTQQTIDWFYM